MDRPGEITLRELLRANPFGMHLQDGTIHSIRWSTNHVFYLINQADFVTVPHCDHRHFNPFPIFQFTFPPQQQVGKSSIYFSDIIRHDSSWRHNQVLSSTLSGTLTSFCSLQLTRRLCLCCFGLWLSPSLPSTNIQLLQSCIPYSVNFQGTKFSQIGIFKHYAATIFVNQGYRIPVYGILKNFSELNFHGCGRSAKITKILRLENLALYGISKRNKIFSGLFYSRLTKKHHKRDQHPRDTLKTASGWTYRANVMILQKSDFVRPPALVTGYMLLHF